MPLLPPRRFARIDRARLRRRRLARALDDLAGPLAACCSGYATFKAAGTIRPLALAYQDVSNVLCVRFRLTPRRVLLRDSPRPHKRRGGRIVYELHGFCTTDGPLEVFARTAARAQPVAPTTLLNTLMHEWMHHYDFETFGHSVHCRGFYQRLDQIFRPSREVIVSGS